MLDIQTRILWAFDIETKRFKSPKFIYTCRATTFMKDKKWDKFILKNIIATKLGWKPSCGRILCFHARFQTGISWASDIEIKQFKSPKFIYVSRTTTLMKDLKWDKIVLDNRIWLVKKVFLIWQCRASKSDWESALSTVTPRTQ